MAFHGRVFSYLSFQRSEKGVGNFLEWTQVKNQVDQGSKDGICTVLTESYSSCQRIIWSKRSKLGKVKQSWKIGQLNPNGLLSYALWEFLYLLRASKSQHFVINKRNLFLFKAWLLNWVWSNSRVTSIYNDIIVVQCKWGFWKSKEKCWISGVLYMQLSDEAYFFCCQQIEADVFYTQFKFFTKYLPFLPLSRT